MTLATAGGYPLLNEWGSAMLAYYIRQYASFAGLALIYYTWLLSVPGEISYVWLRPGWTAKGLYVLVRYGALVATTSPQLLTVRILPPEITCTGNFTFNVYVTLASLLGQFGLILIVIYPLVKKREWWLGAIILSGAVQLVVQWFIFKFNTCDVVNFLAIGPAYQRQANLRVFLEILKLLFDAISFGAILAHTWPLYVATINREGHDTKLVRYLVESGILRIFVIWLFTIVNGILWKTFSPRLLGTFDAIRNAVTVAVICDWYLEFRKSQAQLKVPELVEPENFTTQLETFLVPQDSEKLETVPQTSPTWEDDYLVRSQTTSRENWDIESQVISYTDRGDGGWIRGRRQKKIYDIQRFRP